MIEREMRRQVETLVEELSEEKPRPVVPLFKMPARLAGTPLKVAFIYNTGIEESAWTYSHELGRRYVQERLKGEIVTKYYERVAMLKYMKE